MAIPPEQTVHGSFATNSWNRRVAILDRMTQRKERRAENGNYWGKLLTALWRLDEITRDLPRGFWFPGSHPIWRFLGRMGEKNYSVAIVLCLQHIFEDYISIVFRSRSSSKFKLDGLCLKRLWRCWKVMFPGWRSSSSLLFVVLLGVSLAGIHSERM